MEKGRFPGVHRAPLQKMKIVITGSGGRLGAALLREYGHKFEITGFNHAQLDLGDFEQARATLERFDFDLLINAAAFTNVDLAEKERDQAFRINGDAPRLLAEICDAKGARLIHFSTDYVFDGSKTEPYVEEDEPRPISVYGESKLAGEQAVLSVNRNHLVVRVSWVFGPDRPSFIDQMIERARGNESIAAVADKISTPTYTKDIANVLIQVVAGVGAPGYKGLLHIANSGQCTWQDYAQHAIDCCHKAGVPLKAKHVGALKMSDMKSWVARRPVHSVLSVEKLSSVIGTPPRDWHEALAEYVDQFVRHRISP